jgi:hypothetical protein
MTDFHNRVVEAMARNMWDAGHETPGTQWDCTSAEGGPSKIERMHYVAAAMTAMKTLLSELDAAGWQIVPKAADNTMIVAAIDRPSHDTDLFYREIYAWMLAAAPQPFPEDKS